MVQRVETVRELANKFRTALELVSDDTIIYPFGGFPHGTCLLTCYLLGTYLKDNGQNGFVIQSGWARKTTRQRDRYSHAWLQRGRLVVDITADQFDDVDEAVVVTSNQAWYQKFRDREQYPADLTQVYPHDDLQRLYIRAIKSVGNVCNEELLAQQ